MKKLQESQCFDCHSGTLVPGMVDLVGYRDHEEFTVRVHGLACTTCGFKTLDNAQSGEFTKAISDAFRSAHGFLTGAEIKERRSKWLQMSQRQFADHLGGVGLASVKRWELGQIQDRAMDELIRLKTDPRAARNNLRTVESHVPEQHVVSSFKVGGQDLDLLFSTGQTFTSRPSMNMGKLRIEGAMFENGELVAA
jgi:putative zinc finger/helix-turn-helix YgiT family protein